ncbi:hypothetical protein MNB_SUP05-SYMBIONT-5-124 [hydrothermal vent metagenome]|uniref:Uncharacterized protein n=1 Tax=hydrothermal vent metagenome TaxID=652676 RepID=A0A1W1E0X6_9ZZZZ
MQPLTKINFKKTKKRLDTLFQHFSKKYHHYKTPAYNSSTCVHQSKTNNTLGNQGLNFKPS